MDPRSTEAVLRELEGMRALARSLVHGDADADDLLQDAAVATLEHPPDFDRLCRATGDGDPAGSAGGAGGGAPRGSAQPARGWLAVVLRNRRRMDARGEARRRARETAAAALAEIEDRAAERDPAASLERARAFERLAAALVALAEPFRATVIRRYLDGRSAAEIARELGVPAGTVRWRLKTGLERLRAALDDSQPRWRQALAAPLVPFAGAAAVKTKTLSFVVLVIALLWIAAATIVWLLPGSSAPAREAAPATAAAPRGAAPRPAGGPAAGAAPAGVVDPRPGQGRAEVEAVADLPGGALAGRVINWSTGDGVEGAELTFMGGDDHATTVRSGAHGAFELAPAAPGRFTLAAISAAGYLPYAPELLHSSVRVELAPHQAVRGLTVFLFPAVDYHGRVVDAAGAPVAGARVRLLGTPSGEQAIEVLETEWVSGPDGAFTFHAADDAVLEAVHGARRGWARLDGDAALTHRLVIAIGAAPARDASITGRVVDGAGAPLADVLVRAVPAEPTGQAHGQVHGQARRDPEAAPRATAFATTGADGAFVLERVDRDAYLLVAEADALARVAEPVRGGARDVTLVMEAGATLRGAVASTAGDVIPAFTLLVVRRDGAASELVVARSIVDPRGRFDVRVPAGDYEVSAAASGWAPSAPIRATAAAPARGELRVLVSAGATLRGRVVAADTGDAVPYARIMREARGGGASAQPANAGTVTRADGTFELTGLPPGPVAITIGAAGFHPRIEAGLTASDGAALGPLAVALARLADGERPTLELVGIGVALAPDGDTLRIDRVIPDSGAAAAGLVTGDRVTAIDGVAVTELGLDGAVARIRGVPGTTVAVTVARGGAPVVLVVERRKIRT